MGCLATGCGTKIDHTPAGLWIGNVGDQHRSLILDSHQPVLECSQGTDGVTIQVEPQRLRAIEARLR